MSSTMIGYLIGAVMTVLIHGLIMPEHLYEAADQKRPGVFRQVVMGLAWPLMLVAAVAGIIAGFIEAGRK